MSIFGMNEGSGLDAGSVVRKLCGTMFWRILGRSTDDVLHFAEMGILASREE